jgi:hypothetical protein
MNKVKRKYQVVFEAFLKAEDNTIISKVLRLKYEVASPTDTLKLISKKYNCEFKIKRINHLAIYTLKNVEEVKANLNLK